MIGSRFHGKWFDGILICQKILNIGKLKSVYCRYVDASMYRNIQSNNTIQFWLLIATLKTVKTVLPNLSFLLKPKTESRNCDMKEF